VQFAILLFCSSPKEYQKNQFGPTANHKFFASKKSARSCRGSETAELGDMDPVTVINAVIRVAIAMKAWIDQTKQTDEVMEDLGGTVDRLSNILQHLSSQARVGMVNELLSPEILCLGSILNKTYEHIRVWRPNDWTIKKVVAFVSPNTATEILRNDERKISAQLIMLLFALSTTRYLENDKIKEVERTEGKPNALKWVRNPEVADFWGNYVGSDVQNLGSYVLNVFRCLPLTRKLF